MKIPFFSTRKKSIDLSIGVKTPGAPGKKPVKKCDCPCVRSACNQPDEAFIQAFRRDFQYLHRQDASMREQV